VLLHPVGDGRRVLPEPLRDALDAQAPGRSAIEVMVCPCSAHSCLWIEHMFPQTAGQKACKMKHLCDFWTPLSVGAASIGP
jgi:hypothetical protein